MFESAADLHEMTDAARIASASLLDGDAARLADDDLLLLTAVAEDFGRLADALRLVCAGEIAERSRPELGPDRLSVQRGHANAATLLERIALISGASAHGRMSVAEAVRPRTSLAGEPMPSPFPQVAAAILRGDIGVDAATAITGALAPLRRRVGASDEMDAAEAALVAAALGSDDTLPAAADELRIMAQTGPCTSIPTEHSPTGSAPCADAASRSVGSAREPFRSAQTSRLKRQHNCSGCSTPTSTRECPTPPVRDSMSPPQTQASPTPERLTPTWPLSATPARAHSAVMTRSPASCRSPQDSRECHS